MSTLATKPPMKLYRLILLGLVASITAVGGLIWFFAAYETRDVWPLAHDPRLSQDQWFEVIRNAVTTAAALGVGVTLFLSYRRQQTAEEVQRISADAQLTAANAQRTAAAALKLSTKQHALDQERRRDGLTAELRTRYALTAEQLASDHLAVRLAGIYSMAALADDWAGIGNFDERQVCIDLLGAYSRSPHKDPGDLAERAELMRATMDVVLARIGTGTPSRKYWGSCRMGLENPGQMSSLQGLTLQDGGLLSITGANDWRMMVLSKLDLQGGALLIDGSMGPEMEYASAGISDSVISGGHLNVGINTDQRGRREHTASTEVKRLRRVFIVRDVTLDGGSFSIYAHGWDMLFQNCTFKTGEVSISAGGIGSVNFEGCKFESNVFRRSMWSDDVSPIDDRLAVENCEFEGDAVRLDEFVTEEGRS